MEVSGKERRRRRRTIWGLLDDARRDIGNHLAMAVLYVRMTEHHQWDEFVALVRKMAANDNARVYTALLDMGSFVPEAGICYSGWLHISFKLL